MDFVVEDARIGVRPKRTWKEVVEGRDMKSLKKSKEVAFFWSKWMRLMRATENDSDDSVF